MIGRIPQIESNPEKHWRSVLFLCDEYHSFATTGESDPTGDEKFFALSRHARCIPVVATQSISSLRSTLAGETWRTLLQTFRTKIFLTLSDDFSARTASELCGKEEQLKLNYSISENGQEASGVLPDVEVDIDPRRLACGDDAQVNKALELLQ